MNIIIIVLDSLRQDHVSLYHKGAGPFPDVPACQTPNLDRFAEDCIVFHNAYPEGLPTMPVRLALMTGQWTLPFRRWEPLRETDITIAPHSVQAQGCSPSVGNGCARHQFHICLTAMRCEGWSGEPQVG